mmetsp:Transcript_30285/g.82869  ORF Transcript_30285/g.82869 Transcript_30285/m.82869 type:complete len:93 (-) Transcript_30285:1838-2116(-)
MGTGGGGGGHLEETIGVLGPKRFASKSELGGGATAPPGLWPGAEPQELTESRDDGAQVARLLVNAQVEKGSAADGGNNAVGPSADAMAEERG